MAHIEIDSFVTKFKYLCSAGFRTTLTIEAENGKASVCLKSDLDVLPPQYISGKPRHQSSRNRGPSYQRRQERRQAARIAGNTAGQADVSANAVKANNSTPTETARETISTEKAEEADVAVNKTVEKADKEFVCEICVFTSNWKNGLGVHLSRMHSKMEQLDGIYSDFCEYKKYSETER